MYAFTDTTFVIIDIERRIYTTDNIEDNFQPYKYRQTTFVTKVIMPVTFIVSVLLKPAFCQVIKEDLILCTYTAPTAPTVLPTR